MEQLHQYSQYVNALLSEYTYIAPLFVLCLCIVIGVIMHVYPHAKERWMARKQERREVSDIICTALSEAVLAEKITAKVRAKYEKKLGRALDLGDLIGRPKRIPAEDLKAAIKRRLYRMGSKVQEKLTLMRRRRIPHKKTKLVLKYRP